MTFSIGKYKDGVLCDVVPMQVGHLLLGRPCKYDRKVQHDGLLNCYSFFTEGRLITLATLSPREAHEDQLKIKRENRKNCESER